MRGQQGTRQLAAEVDSIGTHADQSVAGLLLAHIDHLEQRGREARTIESYRGIARKVAADRLGGKMIQDLGPKDFDDFYVRLRSNGLSPRSFGRRPRAATPESHVAFRLLAATGARRGEICGPRWSSVDLDRRVLWIRHSVARLKSGKLIEKDPKSHQTREVAIDKGTAQILRDHRERQEGLAAVIRVKLDPDGYVIADLATDPTGLTPISPDRLTQAFKRVSARVPGAGEVQLHDLRNWYASTQLDAADSLGALIDDPD